MALSHEGEPWLAASSFVGRRETDGAWRIADSHDNLQVSAVAVESDEVHWMGVSPYEDQRDVWERGGPPREGFPVAVRVSERGSEPYYVPGKPEGLFDVTTMAWFPGSGAWIGSPEGVWICHEGQALSWNALHGLPPFAVTAILPMGAGIWIGTEDHGIFHVSTEASTVVHYTKDDGSLPVAGVSSLARSARSEGLWLAGVGGAHWWPINDGARGARDFTGNVGRPVHAVIEDTEGNLWAGSSRGIHCLPVAAVEEAWIDAASEPEWILFGRRDGLEKASVESGHFPAAAQAVDGMIYFCIQGTLVGFEPETLLRRSAFAPSARIEAVGEEERAWRLTTPFTDGALSEALPSDAGDHLQVTFGSTHFTQPDLLSFRYRLPGRSDAWTELGAQDSVWLMDLGPGRRRLEVQVTDHRQRRSSVASVDFRIAPRWHERVVVRSGVGIGVLALVWNWQRQRARQHLARERLNSRLREAADRRRIARDMHDEIGANFAQLKILGELLQNDRVRGDAARDTLAKMVRLAREGSQTLREILWSIGQNSDRDGRDLGEFIRITMEKLLEGTETRLEFHYQWRAPCPIGPLFKREALMITKGVVSNVIRHAHASLLQCIVTGEGDQIRMSWNDNGIGFDPEAVPEDSIGLTTLRERASRWGGSVQIESQPGQGTRVEIVLFLDQSSESEANLKGPVS